MTLASFPAPPGLRAPRAPIYVEPLGRVDPLAEPELARALEHDYLIWDSHVGGERRVDLHPLVLSRAAHRAAVATAVHASRAMDEAAAAAFADPDEAAGYGFHPDVLALARAADAAGDRGSLARVDLLWSGDGFLACEINADCPGGHNEAAGLPALARAAGFHRHHDPTTVLEDLADRLVRESGGPGSPLGDIAIVFCTAYAEDLQVCAIVERAVRRKGGRTSRMPVTALYSVADSLFARGRRVSVIYRYLPTEYLEGAKNAPAIARAVRAGKVRVVASFAEMFAQSKASFARAWALLGPERLEDVIPRTELAPAVTDDELVADRRRWVLKRALGRVGDQVFVGALHDDDDWRAIVRAVREAEGEVWVAQRYAPQVTVGTPWGERYVTLGVYLLDGVFAGYFARLSPESHASHEALVLPVFVEGRG